jgi:hypothetical protein
LIDEYFFSLNYFEKYEEVIFMNGNGKGPMDDGEKTGRQLGYCSGYKNAGFGNCNRNKRRFMQGFRNDIEYTQTELLYLRKTKLQAELEIIEEKLKNLKKN